MQAITVRNRAAGAAGLTLSDIPHPHAAESDVIVRVCAAGFTPGELDWPGTWTDRAGHDRTPSVPGQELSGVVTGLGYGTTGLTVGQRVFGLADWTRDRSLAEYTAVGADAFVDLQADRLEEAGGVDVVLDVIGGEVLERPAPLVRAGGTLVTAVGPPKVRPADGRAIFFVVEPDRLRLADLAERVRSGRLRPIIGAVRPLAEAAAAFTPDHRIPGKTIIRVTEGE